MSIQGYVMPINFRLLRIKGEVDEALAQIEEYVAPVEGKWIEKPVGGSTAGLEFS